MFCIFHITNMKLIIKLIIVRLELISYISSSLVLQQCLFQAHLNWRDGIISSGGHPKRNMLKHLTFVEVPAV